MDYAVLKGTRDYLIANLEIWNSDNCKAMPDEKPDPVMGNEFASVHMINSQGGGRDSGMLDDFYEFAVTVTKRIEAIPYDQVSPEIYLKNLSGIEPLITQITYAIWNRWEVINAMNAAIVPDPQLEQFIENYKFIGPPKKSNRTGKLRFVDEDHFHGDRISDRTRFDGHVGVMLTVYFGGVILQAPQIPGTCE